jgi:hypothetical protein
MNSQPHGQAHLVFPDTQAKAEKPKELALRTHDNTVNFYTIYQGYFTIFDQLKNN